MLISKIKIYAMIAFLLLTQSLTSFGQKKLFVIAGQSNAVGQGDSRTSMKYGLKDCFDYDQKTDSLLKLKDPVGQNDRYFQKANTGSIAPAFAHTLNKLTGDSVIIVAAARGGSSNHVKAEVRWATWSEIGKLSLFMPAIKKIKKAEYKVRHQVDGIIWIQGERDANAISAKEMTAFEYQEALQNLINRFREELGQEVPFYIVLTGFYINHPVEGYHMVRKVQRSVARKMSKVYLAKVDPGKFPKKMWMTDEIHYNQVGYNKIGEELAKQISKNLKSNN